MSIKISLTIACVFAACAPPPKYVREGNKVTRQFVQEMQEVYALCPLGKGGGIYVDKKIDGLYIDFELTKEVAPQEGEELLKVAIANFLEKINQSEALYPYLTHHPFTKEDLSISIAFKNQKGEPSSSLKQIVLHHGVFSEERD